MTTIELECRYLGEKFRFSSDAAIGTALVVESQLDFARESGFRSRSIAIKGNFEEDDLELNQTYRFMGVVRNYKNRRTGTTDKQLHFRSWVPVAAQDKEGIVAYLGQIGQGLGMGRGTAAKAFDEWGQDCINRLREDPESIREINNRITSEQAEAIAALLKERQALESTTIELTSLLHGRGFPKVTSRKAIKAYGAQASQVIRKDPYRLMQFRGCGFALCDALYLELGLAPDSLKRQALCGWYSVASNSDGDTWFPVEQVLAAIRSVAPREENPDRAIEFGRRLGSMSPDHYGAIAVQFCDRRHGALVDCGQYRWIAEGQKARQEEALAEFVANALAEDKPKKVVQFETEIREELTVEDHVRCHRCHRALTAPEVHVFYSKPYGPTCIKRVTESSSDPLASVTVRSLDDWLNSNAVVKKIRESRPTKLVELPACSIWPDPYTLEITDHQKEQLDKALVGRLGILGGSPGTGKTYTVAQLVKSLLASGRVRPDDIGIGAPTGKAAVRVTENLQALNVDVRARTWHSLLGVGEKNEETDSFSFQFDQFHPWPFKVLIGDEESMKDTNLASSVFAARMRGCHILLVGDINQLAPVGHGAPLRDLIAAGVPYGELREIKRSSGGIVEACAAIRDGNRWETSDNLHLHEVQKPEQQIESMLHILEGCRTQYDVVWDCQVLTAVNAKSPLSRKKVNAQLQLALNPNPEINGTPFRLQDKIVCTKNGYYSLDDGELDPDAITDDDHRVYVANGELARVVEIREKTIIASLTAPKRLIVIPRGKVSQKKDSESESENAGTGCNFDLAYALSVHKSQGSEWPVVIPLLDEYSGARRICDRSWIYTGISRAKDHCHLIGKRSVADSMCRRFNLAKRKTFLRELIGLKQAQKLLEAM